MSRIKDCEKMTEGQLLRELVNRFIRYDKARDNYVRFIEDLLDMACMFKMPDKNDIASDAFFMQEYGYDKKREKLHMIQDEKFCQCREIVRIVKKDPYAMLC